MSSLNESTRWMAIKSILEHTGPYQRDGFEPSNDFFQLLQEKIRILVLGAGGLGCEILKDLAILGFRNLEVIDMDTIDLSNLNRQFLFQQSDIGKFKAEVAAKKIESRISGCKVIPHNCRIESMPESFYSQFQCVVCGLDSISARRWINSMLISLLRYDENNELILESVIPLVDGGTEGLQGNVRVVLFTVTPCIECLLSLYPPQTNYPLCTLANTPRLPEHCIEYIRIVQWPKENPFHCEIDGDNPEHINWIMNKSKERALNFKINQKIDFRFTQGVIKHIIPAVASTNAIIASACATEVFKLMTFCHDYLNNYMTFSQLDGAYTYTFEGERRPDCLACSNVPRTVNFCSTKTLEEFIQFLADSDDFQMKKPAITTMTESGSKTLYLDIRGMEDLCSRNLHMTLGGLKTF